MAANLPQGFTMKKSKGIFSAVGNPIGFTTPKTKMQIATQK